MIGGQWIRPFLFHLYLNGSKSSLDYELEWSLDAESHVNENEVWMQKAYWGMQVDKKSFDTPRNLVILFETNVGNWIETTRRNSVVWWNDELVEKRTTSFLSLLPSIKPSHCLQFKGFTMRIKGKGHASVFFTCIMFDALQIIIKKRYVLFNFNCISFFLCYGLMVKGAF